MQVGAPWCLVIIISSDGAGKLMPIGMLPKMECSLVIPTTVQYSGEQWSCETLSIRDPSSSSLILGKLGVHDPYHRENKLKGTALFLEPLWF